jgi:hypothetical protein
MVFHSSVFSTAHYVGPVTDRDGAIEMLMDGDRLARQGVPPTSLVELPPLVRIATVLSLLTTRSVWIEKIQSRSLRPQRREGGAALGGFHGEASIELVKVSFAQEAVGGFDGSDRG